MMRIALARKRSAEANALALAAEKERDAAELEVAELERLLSPAKKQHADEEQGAPLH